MTHQNELRKKKAALRRFAAAVGYKLRIVADDNGDVEYFLSGGQAFEGDEFFAGLDTYDVLDTLEAYAGSHPNYAEARIDWKLAVL